MPIDYRKTDDDRPTDDLPAIERTDRQLLFAIMESQEVILRSLATLHTYTHAAGHGYACDQANNHAKMLRQFRLTTARE